MNAIGLELSKLFYKWTEEIRKSENKVEVAGGTSDLSRVKFRENEANLE